jgi:uncharacterized protein (DUF885 family)
MIIKKLEKLSMRQLKTNSYYSISNNKIQEKFKDKEDRLFIKLDTILKWLPKRMTRIRVILELALVPIG